MTIYFTLGIVGAAVLLTPALQRLLGKAAGWPIAAMYLAACIVLIPGAIRALNDDPITTSITWVPTLGISLSLTLGGISVIFAYIALIIGAVVMVYSTSYLGSHKQLSYFLVMTTFTFAMLTLVMASDLVVLFISWEITSIASFLLIARSGQPGEPASMRTLFLTFIGGVFLLTATVLVWARLGTTNMDEIFASEIWNADPTFTSVMALLVLLAAFTKSAQFPFHVWLPDAMAAITPVSAYLHAAAVVKAGIFLLLRFSPMFHAVVIWNLCLIVVGLGTSLLGAWFAMQQTDLKKLMAYSTVSQLGLIVATIGIGTHAAIAAAIIHTIAHALFKSGLFMMVGVVDHATHTRDLRRLPPALYKKMPYSFAVTLLGCASMAGVPPMLGFLTKESILSAMAEAPGPAWTGWAALTVTAAGAILTLSYSFKIVLGTFVDGPEDSREVEHLDGVLVGAAGLPILASLPLAFTAFLFDQPVGAAADAALVLHDSHLHFALWHGFTLEVWITIAILVIGAVIAWQRKPVFRAVEARVFPYTGADVINQIRQRLTDLSMPIQRFIAYDHASRHVLAILGSFGIVGIAGATWVTTKDLPPVTPGVNRPIDMVLLLLIVCAVLVVCMARLRLTSVAALSAVGILASAQILVLGAPDVAMTQFLVEALTIIVMMLVLQKLPKDFKGRRPFNRFRTLMISLIVGAGAAGLVYTLNARRNRSALSSYYLNETEQISGGHNVVNIILVEFRAFDTLGELAVLGMAGLAIVAVFSTVRHRHLDPMNRDEAAAKAAKLPLQQDPDSAAFRAIMVAWPNVVPLQLMLKVIVPILALVAFLLFWRGHNQPGGGFNAALITGAIVGLAYLSTSRDRQLGPPRAPLYLIGGGIMIAVLTGAIGLVKESSFLQPLHGYIGGVHLSTSMLFDLGVYTAVVGLIIISFNLLGTSMMSYENTRERVDEAIEGELPGPLDTVRGERVARTSTTLSSGIPPEEIGR